MMIVNIKYPENATKEEKNNLYEDIMKRYGKELASTQESASLVGIVLCSAIGLVAGTLAAFYYKQSAVALGSGGLLVGTVGGMNLSAIVHERYKTKLENRISRGMGLEVRLKN